MCGEVISAKLVRQGKGLRVSKFHRVNVMLTDSQMKVMMLESQATGLRIGTLLRIMLHEDIASGRALKHFHAADADRKAQIRATAARSKQDE